jgi:hypothetical protein
MISRGTKEMMEHIADQGGLVKDMWDHRDENLIELYRVCSEREAFNTWINCLAGGEYRSLTQITAPESVAVNQVGNNEGMPGRGGVDSRLAVLAKLQKEGQKVVMTTAPREVVEYSHRPARQFSGALIKIAVNKLYTVKGSGLSFEGGGGVILQIGTPLSWVETDQSNVDFTHRFI